jgi:hypothetical protein
MIRVHRLYPLAILAMAIGPLAGCATAFHRGNGLTAKAQENGQEVRLLAMNLDHATRDLRIYEGDVEVPISPVRDHIWANAIKSSLREAVARGAAAGSCSGVCTYNWNETTEFGPGVFLNPHRPHTLRLVRGDQQATVTVNTSWRLKWYFYDMALFVLAPVGWVVDGVTGSWNEFSRLDVDRAFRSATASAAGAMH